MTTHEGNFHLYTVVESRRFLEDVADLVGTLERWDEIRETLLQDLPRNPQVFFRIPETDLRAVTLLTDPPLTVYFTINDQRDEVRLEAIF